MVVEAEPWMVALVGAGAAAATVVFLVLLALKRLRDRKQDVAPISSRRSHRPGPPSSRPPSLR